MAEQGIERASVVHKVWTFQLFSGPGFELRLPGNPMLEFDGHQTIWKMVGTEAVAQDAKRLMESMGVKVTLFTEDENEDMVAERERLRNLKLEDILPR